MCTVKAQSIRAMQVKSLSEDSLNQILKYKIKSITVQLYKTNDSTLTNLKLETKTKSVYNISGLMQETLDENASGKVTYRYVAKFNDQNQETEYTTYDSLSKITAHVRYVFDDTGRVIQTTSTMPMSQYLYKPGDADKMVTLIYKDVYDRQGNMIESTTDSSGVETSKTINKYDAQKRLIHYELYDHDVLQMILSNVYDTKGGYTSTEEYYQKPSRTQCSPATNKTVSKYDEKERFLSSVVTSDDDGSITTTTTTVESTYNKADKPLMEKTTSETMGDGSYSKTTTIQVYSYDANENMIESSSKYPSGAISSTMKLKYNDKNSITEEITYEGKCMDKPSNITTYLYYPDGMTQKETISNSYGAITRNTTEIDERGLMIGYTSTNMYGSTRAVYTYEFR